MTEHQFLRVALLPYVGESCVYCRHKFQDVDDIMGHDVVRGPGEEFILACRSCYRAHGGKAPEAKP